MNIKDKQIPNLNTTILCSSTINYKEDTMDLIKNNCTILSKDDYGHIEEIPDSMLLKFKITDLKTKSDLSKIDNLKISILTNLIDANKTVVLYNILTYLDKEFKEQLIEHLKETDKQIINYTTEIEETLYLDYIIVINKQGIVMEGTKEEILKEEKILNKLGFHLPLLVALSNDLKYYNLLNETYYTKESLVNALWK